MGKKLITVNNLKEFIEARGFGEGSFKDVERNTYKHTDCGAWIREERKGITVGSIVEGVDYDCTPETVTYPFKMDEFWQALKNVEWQADEIWKDTYAS
jgi:hypothetical protein